MTHSRERQVQRLAELVQKAAPDDEDTYSFAMHHLVMCGDCGVHEGMVGPDVCPQCGGFAIPCPNRELVKRFKVR